MLAVTQLEVYVLERGRWTLHARYAGEDKKEAMWDAQSTEATTGFPAKIVRETFFPELNDSERITTYISPNAKKATKDRPVGTTPRPRTPLKARTRATGNLRQLNAAQIMLRVLVAGAFSVIAAAVMAFVIKWVLQSFADIGLTISPAATSMIMTYSWVAMFLLFFFSLFRSRLQLHRVLADMWQSSARTAAAAQAAPRVKPVNLKLKPKHDRATSPETLREWQDLRMRRGDPDIFSSPDDLAPELPINGAAPDAADGKPTADRKTFEAVQDKAAQEKAAADKAAKDKPLSAKEQATKDQAAKDEAAKEQAAKERAAKAKAAADKAALEKALEKTGQDIAAAEKKAADAAKAAKAEKDFIAPPPTLDDTDDFAHTALRRFIADVVKPAAAASMRDDPVARRGMALAIAGAVDAVAARPETRGLDGRALLGWGLSVAGIAPSVAELFLASHEEYVGQAANQSLVATGQGLMADMIPLSSPNTAVFVDTLASALAAWRTPFGQPGVLVADPEPVSQFEPPTAGDMAKTEAGATDAAFETPANGGLSSRLLDVFLLTELRPPSRHDDALNDDARMAAHNDRVREALSTSSGQEIKHTGKGIFARFGDPGVALATARELQRDLGRGIALAVIGNSNAQEDPVLSSTLFLRAESAMNVTGDGQASVEAHVIGEGQRLGQPTDLVVLTGPPAAPVS